MTEENEYDLKPPEKPPAALSDAGSPDPAAAGGAPPLKPGDPGWVPPAVIIEKADAAEEEEVPPDPDVEKHKVSAILAYICFLIPLVAAPHSKFARYHANQGLLVFMTLVLITVIVAGLYLVRWIAGNVLHDMGMLDYFFGCGLAVLQFALLIGWVALVVDGIIHAANGEKKPLPVVGHWTLIK